MAARKTVTSGHDMERYFKRVDSPFLPASSAFLFLKIHQHIVFIFFGTCPTTIPSLRMATAYGSSILPRSFWQNSPSSIIITGTRLSW